MNGKYSLVIVSKALAPYRVRFYSEVAKNLALQGWRVTLIVATLGAKDHPWLDLGLNDEHLNIIGIATPNEKSTRQTVVDLLAKWLGKSDLEIPNLQLFNLLEQHKADVVWTHEYSPFCLAAALWAAVRDRGSILSTDLGSQPPEHACTPRQLQFQKWVSFLYQGVIAHTKEATRRKHPEGAPIVFAPHAIDTDAYVPAEHSESATFQFLFVAGIRAEKGIIEVIEAGNALAAEGYDFMIRVVGSGPLDGWLAKQNAPWLTVAGFVEGTALSKEYQASDAYVLPTKGDTYGLTIHEAAASGLPLIVGRTAGAAESLINEGITGFAIDATDVATLILRMKLLMTDRSRAKEMGKQARRLAETLDVKLLGQHTANFILLQHNGNSR